MPQGTYRYFIIPARPAILGLGEEVVQLPPPIIPNSKAPPVPPFVTPWRWKLAHSVERLHENFQSKHMERLDSLSLWQRRLVIPLICILVVPYLMLALTYGLLLLHFVGLRWLFQGKAGFQRASATGGAWFSLLFMGELNTRELFAGAGPMPGPDQTEVVADGEIIPGSETVAEVAKVLVRARRLGYKIAVYANSDALTQEHEAGSKLKSTGWIEDYLPEMDSGEFKNWLRTSAIHIGDSLLVLDKVEQLALALEVGFCPSPQRPIQGEVIGWGRFASYYGRPDNFSARDFLAIGGYYLHSQRVAQTTAGLPEELVIYVEDTPSPAIRAFIQRHLARIEKALEAKQLRFLFLPSGVDTDITKQIVSVSLLPGLRRRFPKLLGVADSTILSELTKVAEQLTVEQFSQALLLTVGLSDFARPALLRRVDSYSTGSASFTCFSLVPPSGLDLSEEEEWLEKALAEYLTQVGGREQGPMFSLNPGPKEYDADWKFSSDGNTLPQELIESLGALELSGGPAALAQVLLRVAAQLRSVNPELLISLAPHLSVSSEPRVSGIKETPLKNGVERAAVDELSELVVTSDLRIILPAYGNLEIVLTPLPKVLYLFFLRYPQGMMFHDLVDYRAELEGYYKMLQPTVLLPTVAERIRDLTDVRSNSVNEKCSRIKEAFVRHLDECVAKHYYITGQRGGKKAISLPRQLVQWEEVKKDMLLSN